MLKKTLVLLAVAGMFAGCTNKSNNDKKNPVKPAGQEQPGDSTDKGSTGDVSQEEEMTAEEQRMLELNNIIRGNVWCSNVDEYVEESLEFGEGETVTRTTLVMTPEGIEEAKVEEGKMVIKSNRMDFNFSERVDGAWITKGESVHVKVIVDPMGTELVTSAKDKNIFSEGRYWQTCNDKQTLPEEEQGQDTIAAVMATKWCADTFEGKQAAMEFGQDGTVTLSTLEDVKGTMTATETKSGKVKVSDDRLDFNFSERVDGVWITKASSSYYTMTKDADGSQLITADSDKDLLEKGLKWNACK